MSWAIIAGLTVLYWAALLLRMRMRGRKTLARAVEQSAPALGSEDSFEVRVPIDVKVARAVGVAVMVPMVLIGIRLVIQAAH